MINKYQLAAEGGIAHVVVMQHITRLPDRRLLPKSS